MNYKMRRHQKSHFASNISRATNNSSHSTLLISLVYQYLNIYNNDMHNFWQHRLSFEQRILIVPLDTAYTRKRQCGRNCDTFNMKNIKKIQTTQITSLYDNNTVNFNSSQMASLHTHAADVLNQTESNVHCLIISFNFFFFFWLSKLITENPTIYKISNMLFVPNSSTSLPNDWVEMNIQPLIVEQSIQPYLYKNLCHLIIFTKSHMLVSKP